VSSVLKQENQRAPLASIYTTTHRAIGLPTHPNRRYKSSSLRSVPGATCGQGPVPRTPSFLRRRALPDVMVRLWRRSSNAEATSRNHPNLQPRTYECYAARLQDRFCLSVDRAVELSRVSHRVNRRRSAECSAGLVLRAKFRVQNPSTRAVSILRGEEFESVNHTVQYQYRLFPDFGPDYNAILPGAVCVAE